MTAESSLNNLSSSDELNIDDILKEHLFELEEADYEISLADRKHYNL